MLSPRRSSFFVLSFLALALLPVPSTRSAPTAPRYTVTDLGTLGGAESEAQAINNGGIVVGEAEIGTVSAGGTQVAHAFQWRDGQIRDLDAQDPGGSVAWGISDLGVAAGSTSSGARLWLPDGSSHPLRESASAYAVNTRGEACGAIFGLVHVPVVWKGLDDAQWRSLRHQVGVARSINNHGVAAGWDDGTESPVGLLWTAHSITVLHPHRRRLRDEFIDWANAVSDRGEVAGGLYSALIGARAFVWRNGRSRLLPPPASFDGSEATALNDQGLVVGVAWTEPASNGSHAVCWKDNWPLDLNDLADTGDWVLLRANGINTRGQIVGTGLHNGVRRGFLLTPL